MTPTEHDGPEWDDEDDIPDWDGDDIPDQEPHPEASAIIGAVPPGDEEGPYEDGTEVRVTEITRDDSGYPIAAKTVEHFKVDEGKKVHLTTWSCSGCAAKWKQDPGKFHSHEVPVPGSKSRVTYENHAISKVSG
ncbi:hypothetical protein LCGC14_1085410 [marine sediment metagenome]|uniref:Uncharacterized protein n=1 Tax=marine sediment metagenome TaxID=412755 RepID=A0A0F9MIF0_9ZZZZ